MTTGAIDRRWRHAGLAALGFLALGAVAERGPVRGEVAATEVVNALPTSVVSALEIVMQLGARGAIVVVAIVTFAISPGDAKRAGLAVLLAGTLGWLASDVAKEVVERPRPGAFTSELELHERATGLGWPSTHTTIATASLAAGAIGAGRRPTAAVGLAAVVGLGRMAVGVHLPLDVVGGLLLGVALAFAVTAVFEP